MFGVYLTFEWLEDVMVFLVFIFIFFCLESSLRRCTSMRTTSFNDMVIFSTVKTNQDIIGEQCISDNDGVLVCSETFKKIVSMG